MMATPELPLTVTVDDWVRWSRSRRSGTLDGADRVSGMGCSQEPQSSASGVGLGVLDRDTFQA